MSFKTFTNSLPQKKFFWLLRTNFFYFTKRYLKVKITKSDPNSIWLYNASFLLSIVVAALYTILMIIQLYQTVFHYKSYYFLVVIFGVCLEVGGYVVRAVSIKNPDSLPPYAISSSFIVLTPLFVGAGNSLLITRLCKRVLPASITHIHRIPVAILTKIFVTCDIISCLIQVSGTGIASSGNWQGSTVKIGTDVLIVGLATQVVTFLFFVSIVGRFHQLTRAGEVRVDEGNGWRLVLKAVYISSALIIIRSIYRLIKFAMGFHGYPFTYEWIFYVLESLPMLPAILLFCVWHPARYFGGRASGKSADLQLESSDGRRA